MTKICRICGHYSWVHCSNRFTRCQGWWPSDFKATELKPDGKAIKGGYEYSWDVFAECFCHETVDSVQESGTDERKKEA